VFVVPANINMMSFHGSFNLIRDGATLVDNPDQVLGALGIRGVSAPQLAPSSSTGERILSILSSTPLATEFIVEKTGLDTGGVLSELTLLELEGKVIRDGVGYALRP
jgi:DNA processing protein